MKENQTLRDLRAAAQAVIDIFPEQFCPLEDLCVAVARLEHVLSRSVGRQVKDRHRADLITGLRGQGNTVAEIVAATGIPETTVRRHYRK